MGRAPSLATAAPSPGGAAPASPGRQMGVCGLLSSPGQPRSHRAASAGGGAAGPCPGGCGGPRGSSCIGGDGRWWGSPRPCCSAGDAGDPLPCLQSPSSLSLPRWRWLLLRCLAPLSPRVPCRHRRGAAATPGRTQGCDGEALVGPVHHPRVPCLLAACRPVSDPSRSLVTVIIIMITGMRFLAISWFSSNKQPWGCRSPGKVSQPGCFHLQAHGRCQGRACGAVCKSPARDGCCWARHCPTPASSVPHPSPSHRQPFPFLAGQSFFSFPATQFGLIPGRCRGRAGSL